MGKALSHVLDNDLDELDTRNFLDSNNLNVNVNDSNDVNEADGDNAEEDSLIKPS